MQRNNSFEVLDIEQVISEIDGECEVKSDVIHTYDECFEDPELIHQDTVIDILPPDTVEDTLNNAESLGSTDEHASISTPILVVNSYSQFENLEEDVAPEITQSFPRLPVVDISSQTIAEPSTGHHTSGRILIATVLMAAVAVIISYSQSNDAQSCPQGQVSSLQEELVQIKQLYNNCLIRDSNKANESRRTILELQAERLKLYTALGDSQQTLKEISSSYENLQAKYQELEAVMESVRKDRGEYRQPEDSSIFSWVRRMKERLFDHGARRSRRSKSSRRACRKRRCSDTNP